MTNQEKTQAVLKAVRNTEGLEHLKELSFGCIFRLQNQDDDGWLFEVVREVYKNRVIAYEVGKRSVSIIPLHNIRVVGHPVQWSDVLVAMDINKAMGHYIQFNMNEWELTITLAKGHSVLDLTVTVSLLKTPEQNMLDNPELTDFLYELLVKK